MSDPRWYDPETLEIVEQVPSADGKKMVKCTITHARKLGLVPSVTSIIKEVLTSGQTLTDWLINQHVETAMAFPFDGDILDEIATDQYKRMVKAKAGEYGRAAADEGTRLHGEVNRWIEDGIIPTDPVALRMVNQIQARVTELEATHGTCVKITTEEAVGSKEHGFCGTPDAMLHFESGYRIIADIKTSMFKSFKKPYDSWRSQLGGYSIITESDPNTGLEQWVFDRLTGEGLFLQHEDPAKWRQHFANLRDCFFIQKG